MMKLSNKAISAVVSVAVVAGTIGAAAAVSNNNIAQKALSSSVSSTINTAVSSQAVSSAPAASSKAAEPSTAPKGEVVSTVTDGIDAIKQATDEGVSKIHEETSKAVSKIKIEVPVKHKLSASGKIVLKSKSNPKRNDAVDLTVAGYDFSTEGSSYVAFGYGGHFLIDNGLDTVAGLKNAGLKLLDVNGKEISFTDYKDMMWIKVPYTNLSDISTMYLTYKDQKITITIS